MALGPPLRRMLDDLDDEGVPHMVVGALAMDALDVPRTTYDIDLQIGQDTPPPVSEGSYLGWFIEERSRDPVFGQDVLIVHSVVDPDPIELFFTSHWFTRQALYRRQALHSERAGRDVHYPTPEDFVLLKAAYMASPERSARKKATDGVDIEAVIRRQSSLDRAYIEANAAKLGIAAVVARFFEPRKA